MAIFNMQSLDVCPFCGHDNIEYDSEEVYEGEYTERGHCLDCDEVWSHTFVYHHTNADLYDGTYYAY